MFCVLYTYSNLFIFILKQDRLVKMQNRVQLDFNNLGVVDLPSSKSKSDRLLDTLKKFCEAYKSQIFGGARYNDIKKQLAKQKISYIFHVTFAQSLASIDPLQDMTEEEILIAILGSRDLESSLFHPEVRSDE